ncbi:MAG: acyl-ACP--UDP-N-acetylglucosamine O-acyltransferase [Prevotellaceae bacterium]|jgi:UDP-N-acetylglucosamine acyltransferase|nr:acyl-ACP--UDP-N-acetylglucosamine O-acyltransferase [Prevotellaceae bacterium]
MIHSTAIIHPTAKIGENVEIEPFVTIGENVEIGDGTVIMAKACIVKNVKMGKNNRIFHSAVIGSDPQDLKFAGEETFVEIGDNNTLREFVSVHRGTASRGKTVIGNGCLIMAYCHVAHDCVLQDNIIMSNAVQLAGEVEIDNFAILGGGALLHQFSKIGKHVMIQGGALVNKDIPPFITAAREPISFAGINIVGLRRRGFSNEQIADIQDIYRIIMLSGLNVTNAVQKVEAEFADTEIRAEILDFIKASTRGILNKVN